VTGYGRLEPLAGPNTGVGFASFAVIPGIGAERQVPAWVSRRVVSGKWPLQSSALLVRALHLLNHAVCAPVSLASDVPSALRGLGHLQDMF
jgi:hypothetical protein